MGFFDPQGSRIGLGLVGFGFGRGDSVVADMLREDGLFRWWWMTKIRESRYAGL